MVRFTSISVLLCLAAWLVSTTLDAWAPLSESWWWPASLAFVTGVTVLARWWVGHSATKSPMGFVASVNGSTALKMFAVLGIITTYIMTHEEGRVPFALGTFVIFAAQLVWFVWDTTKLMRENKKNS